MKHIDFYFDPISPYAYLAFEHLPKALCGLSYSVSYRPVLFAGMLQAFGQLGPAEIAPKRVWMHRQVHWLAKDLGVELQFPASHPFNPLGSLRLALACGQEGQCSRYVAESVFRHVWRGGHDAADAQRLAALQAQLAPGLSPLDAGVKAQLKANTDAAIALGVFGVPMMRVDEENFWGLDALGMLRACLQGDAWFSQAGWQEAKNRPDGLIRPKNKGLS